jgi:two-component system sensor histidine kinase DesK
MTRAPATPLIRTATAGVVAGSIGFSGLELVRMAVGWVPDPGRAVPALLATACYLPWHVRHIWYAARGSRPPAGGWTLAAMAVVVIGALPVIGTSWLIALPMLAVSVLVIVRPPWSILIAAGLVAAPAPLAIGFGDADWAPLYAASVIWQGGSLFVLVWLIGASRRLQDARLVLAEQAVVAERLRLDGELRRILGSTLEQIVATGHRTAGLAEPDPAAAGEALRGLVEDSRASLAEVRRAVTRYRDVSLRAELDVAATLLRAGGIETDLLVPEQDRAEPLDPASRSELRAAVGRLLLDGSVRHCSIVATRQAGRTRLEVRPTPIKEGAYGRG